MPQKIFLLTSFVLLAACAEKNIQSGNETVVDKLASVSSSSFTRPQPTQPVELVFDKKYNERKPVNYRANSELRMSGSAAYTPAALREIAKPVKKKKSLLYVVDLRQESHGLINDQPVTWQADRDWANADLTHDEAVLRERRLLGDLHVGEKLEGVEIKSIETEESLVRSSGHQYVRLTVTDHVRPADSEVDRFLEMVKGLPPEAWVHFHCRAGKGRTTTFMVMYDILKNAPKDSLQAIIERNTKLSNDYDVLATVPTSDWKYPYQKDRAEFIERFYAYAKENPKIEKLWAEWIRK